MTRDVSRRRSTRRLTSILRILFGASAALVAATLLLALAIAWLWPDDGLPSAGWAGRFTLLCFYARVFQMHLGLAALAASTFAIACRCWRSGLTLALASAIALSPYAREYAPKSPPTSGRTIRVLSMNLYAYNYDAPHILAAIDQADADVIVASEVTAWSMSEVFAKIATRYPRSAHPDYDGGAVVLSRLPFTIDRTAHPPGPRNPLLFTIDGRAVALYPVHTISPGAVSHLMRNREQLRQLADIAAAETRPTIIVGDLNCSQLTPNYRWLNEAGLRTTHELIGFGVGTTWGPKWHPWLNRLPGVRIDQMFLSRDLTATSHRVGPYTGSDHLPIIADVGFAIASP